MKKIKQSQPSYPISIEHEERGLHWHWCKIHGYEECFVPKSYNITDEKVHDCTHSSRYKYMG